MKVIAYLDCGCAIVEDGKRVWCPTCSADIHELYEPTTYDRPLNEHEQEYNEELTK